MADSQLGTDPGGGFRDPDKSGEVQGLVAFLDDLRARPTIIENKRADIEAMELASGMWALDVGCGTGEDVQSLAGLVGPAGRAVGVDLSAQIIEEARKRLPHGISQTEFHVASAELPFEDQTFDGIHCERLLQHVSDP